MAIASSARPAFSGSAVAVAFGCSDVTETPVPRSSVWSASENEWTNAFVAA